jgi:hypothetical protein
MEPLRVSVLNTRTRIYIRTPALDRLKDPTSSLGTKCITYLSSAPLYLVLDDAVYEISALISSGYNGMMRLCFSTVCHYILLTFVQSPT